MTNEIQQLVTLFEESGLSPELIAADRGCEVGAIKAVLFANSGIYRESLKELDKSGVKPNPLDFTTDDEHIANGVIKRVAQFSEDDNTALKAAIYLKNERRGRNDVKKGFRNLNLNVAVIQDHWNKAAAALGIKVGESGPKQLVDV